MLGNQESVEMTNSSVLVKRQAKSGADWAQPILYRLFRGYDANIHVRFWDGSEVFLGHGRPEFSLTFRSSKAFQILLSKRKAFSYPVPLTRRDLYCQPC